MLARSVLKPQNYKQCILETSKLEQLHPAYDIVHDVEACFHLDGLPILAVVHVGAQHIAVPKGLTAFCAC
jgi:hypothetical protein